jgi:pimeloyl-ACP methyl ester carboxylesterase
MTTIRVGTIALPNGESYGFRQCGAGDLKLLLLHGNMTSSKHMEILMQRFPCDEYTVMAIDMRGFGFSSYKQPIAGLRDLSDDVKLFCDALGWRGFMILGWSTGGGVAMQFAADHPGYAERLILMNSMSARGYPFYSLDDTWTPLLNQRLTTREQIGNQARNRHVQDAFNRKDKAALRAIWEAVIYTHCRPPEPLYEAYLDDMLTQRNLMDIYHALNTFNISEIHHDASVGTGAVKRVTLPTLILWGRRDLVVTEPMTLELMADLPHARVLWLEDCGHSPLMDQMELLTAAIMEFTD